jgi:uncharacterized protein involved in exopolysaccharide biosynthesis
VIAVCALLGTIVFGILASTQAALFVSRSSFLVRSGKSPVTIPGGAGTLGFSLAAYLEFSQSVAFYADLARAMPTLRRVAAEQYTTSSSTKKRSLAEAMGIEDKNPSVALERDVGMRQQIYTALAQTYEQARIEENRVPTILNVVEPADLPVEPQRREALRKTLIGLVTGLLAGMVIAMLQQRVEEKKSIAY